MQRQLFLASLFPFSGSHSTALLRCRRASSAWVPRAGGGFSLCVSEEGTNKEPGSQAATPFGEMAAAQLSNQTLLKALDALYCSGDGDTRREA